MSYVLQYATDSEFTQNQTTISTAATEYTSTITLADGTWYWRVRSVDAVGNTSGWSGVWSFIIDTIRPNVMMSPSFEATPTGTGWTLTTTKSSIEIRGSISDATGVVVKINGETVPVVGGSFTKTVNLAVLGTNTFTITVVDAAGNATTRTLSVTRVGAEAPSGVAPSAPGPEISSEMALWIGAAISAVIVLIVLAKIVLPRRQGGRQVITSEVSPSV